MSGPLNIYRVVDAYVVGVSVVGTRRGRENRKKKRNHHFCDAKLAPCVCTERHMPSAVHKFQINFIFLKAFHTNGWGTGGGGGGEGFRLKPQMKVSFVWMWPYRILDERAQKECSWRVVHVLLQNQLDGWGAERHHCGAGHESRINPNNTEKLNLRKVRGSIFFFFAACVVCWWHEVWAPFQGRRSRTTLSLRILGRENCFAVTRRCFLRTKSEKLFPSRPSFLRRRTSTGFASRRFSCWQSENQKDSRLGRVRIIISDGTCALLNAQQIKMVSREACVCAMCSRTGQGLHVCMRAYLRNLLGTAAHCWPNPCCGTAFVQFFCSLFVNLLCRKPEIDSLGFTCNWLVLVGRLVWTSAPCTYFRVADKFTTAKRKAGTLYHAKSFGIPSIRLVVA